MTARRAWPALLLLVLTACEETEADRAQRALAEAAHLRNANIAAALTVAAVVALRLLAFRLSDPAARATPPRPHRLPPVLVAAAVGSELAGLLGLAFVGSGIGYVFGPAPEDPGLDGIGIALTAILAAPFALLTVVASVRLIAFARRVPPRETSSFVLAMLGHVVITGLGVLAVFATNGVWAGLGAGLVVAGVLGAGGYGYGCAVRARVARAVHRARQAAPPR